jgi:DNA-binding NtrC family response regulator|tara:strand:- start:1158 stop:2510 length:1353 start_codon:yes stop_codon:yes gene_type:complete
MDKYCLFYYKCEEMNEELNKVKRSLINAGWQLKNIIDTSLLELRGDQGNEVVCIYWFDEINLNDTHFFESINSQYRYEWIGLTQQCYLNNIEHRNFLARNFFDYHTYPFDIKRLKFSLGHALGMGQLKNDLYNSKANERIKINEMIGQSIIMQKLFKEIYKAAPVNIPVLISGESGTGKELIAKAIHLRSSRKNNELIIVNCGALAPNLIQSELFGHEKGAFTGANARKIGRIESADKGTLFLDEIGDLSLDLQVNLLRFLQEGTIDRLGGTKTIQVDVRVIAASNINLQSAVKSGKFREDLYYRLHVIKIHSPALRERTDDILLVADYYFKRFRQELNKQVLGFSKSALIALNLYSWPGNVRELSNRVKGALIMCEGEYINPNDLCLPDITQLPPTLFASSLNDVREKAERDAITNRMKVFNNNVSQVAKNLKVSRVTLYRLLKKYVND